MSSPQRLMDYPGIWLLTITLTFLIIHRRSLSSLWWSSQTYKSQIKFPYQWTPCLPLLASANEMANLVCGSVWDPWKATIIWSNFNVQNWPFMAKSHILWATPICRLGKVNVKLCYYQQHPDSWVNSCIHHMYIRANTLITKDDWPAVAIHKVERSQ